MGPNFEPPYSRQLGLLAATLGRLDEAVAHLEACEAQLGELAMRSHLARVRYDLAGVLLTLGDRDRALELLAAARSLATELGQVRLIELIDARLPARGSDELTLVREGEYWTIGHGGRAIRLRDSRGLRILDQLVTARGRELHVLELAGADDADPGDAGEVIDTHAIQAYRMRLVALRDELEDAEARSDLHRAERARTEMDVLTSELARAVGLGGRTRRTSGAAERARTAVQKRVRDAIRRIGDELPALGRHLELHIRTGMFCGYLVSADRPA